VELESDLEHLEYVDESESERYNSKAVFSEVGLGVEVEEYDTFTLYSWERDTSFSEVIDAVERFFPFSVDPGLEMLVKKDEALVYDSDRDHDEMRNDFIYDPVREWRTENGNGYEPRWRPYELVQINLPEAKVVWDEKTGESRIRVYELEEGLDVFEKIFPELVDSESAKGIAEDSSSFNSVRVFVFFSGVGQVVPYFFSVYFYFLFF